LAAISIGQREFEQWNLDVSALRCVRSGSKSRHFKRQASQEFWLVRTNCKLWWLHQTQPFRNVQKIGQIQAYASGDIEPRLQFERRRIKARCCMLRQGVHRNQWNSVVVHVCDATQIDRTSEFREHSPSNHAEEVRRSHEPQVTRNNGSSGNSGECRPDFEEEVVVVAEAVGHSLDHLDLVHDALQEACMQGVLAMGEDPVDAFA